MYAEINFKTKKALKEAVANGDAVRVYQPGPFGDNPPSNGRITLEGPHFPKPHRWYANAWLENGRVIKVK